MTATRPLAVIILAAGQGTRMKSAKHKVLHPVAGRPMLLHLLASVAELRPERQVVVVGAGREQVEAAVAEAEARPVLEVARVGDNMFFSGTPLRRMTRLPGSLATY